MRDNFIRSLFSYRPPPAVAASAPVQELAVDNSQCITSLSESESDQMQFFNNTNSVLSSVAEVVDDDILPLLEENTKNSLEEKL